MNYGIGNGIIAEQVMADASNLRAGANNAYTVSNFLEFYPQFDSTIVPTVVIQLYINLATNCIKQSRWRGAWELAMGLFVAHFVQLWLRSSSSSEDGKDAIVSAGQTHGLIVSESVDGVSYSMDVGAVTSGLEGYGAWISTDFGLSLVSMAKMYGKGGMMV